MNNTAVSICNTALLRLGQKQIQSLTEQSQVAQVCSMFYDTCRKRALRFGAWRFAQKVVALAQSAVSPSTWAYAYAIPADCIRIIRLEIPHSLIDIEFEPVGAEIWTDLQGASLRYIWDIEDPSRFDETFVDVLASLLTVEMAVPLTADSGRQATAMRMFEMSLLSAKGACSSEARRKPKTGRGIADARL